MPSTRQPPAHHRALPRSWSVQGSATPGAYSQQAGSPYAHTEPHVGLRLTRCSTTAPRTQPQDARVCQSHQHQQHMHTKHVTLATTQECPSPEPSTQQCLVEVEAAAAPCRPSTAGAGLTHILYSEGRFEEDDDPGPATRRKRSTPAARQHMTGAVRSGCQPGRRSSERDCGVHTHVLQHPCDRRGQSSTEQNRPTAPHHMPCRAPHGQSHASAQSMPHEGSEV